MASVPKSHLYYPAGSPGLIHGRLGLIMLLMKAHDILWLIPIRPTLGHLLPYTRCVDQVLGPVSWAGYLHRLSAASPGLVPTVFK